jgi:hypothetical protein
MDNQVVPVSGLVTFRTLAELRLYLKQLLTYYEQNFDVYSQKVGRLMRLYEKESEGVKIRRSSNEDWLKVGMLMVNKRDSLVGTLETMLESMEEFKMKLDRTSEVLQGFVELEELNVQDGTFVTLYLRNGVPMRIVFDSPLTKVPVPEIAPVPT